MSFCSKLGNLVKQNIFQNGNVPVESALKSILCFSSSKLYVRGFSTGRDDRGPREASSTLDGLFDGASDKFRGNAQFSGRFGRDMGPGNGMGRQRFMGGWDNDERGRNFKSINFVRGVVDEDGGRYSIEQNADIVHIKLLRNNTFVTVTDSKGNIKLGASSGSLEGKGGPKVSRYASEATAEHVGRQAKNLGLKSVVVKVNGFTHFSKKKKAIISFREGFASSRSDRNPIVYLEDATRKPHNGCRLPKKRRI